MSEISRTTVVCMMMGSLVCGAYAQDQTMTVVAATKIQIIPVVFSGRDKPG